MSMRITIELLPPGRQIVEDGTVYAYQVTYEDENGNLFIDYCRNKTTVEEIVFRVKESYTER